MEIKSRAENEKIPHMYWNEMIVYSLNGPWDMAHYYCI